MRHVLVQVGFHLRVVAIGGLVLLVLVLRMRLRIHLEVRVVLENDLPRDLVGADIRARAETDEVPLVAEDLRRDSHGGVDGGAGSLQGVCLREATVGGQRIQHGVS
ncbi:MAG TPA: hypothetical protein QGF05_07345, partial [Dehalococcoidia bacterium]|nr:hypothetical protein [Dehalococcoidia bacterium]